MDRILIILKKENGPRASSAPALGLNTIIFKHIYWYMQQTQVSVYRTIGPLVLFSCYSHQSGPDYSWEDLCTLYTPVCLQDEPYICMRIEPV